MEYIQKPRCHGKRENMQRQVQALKDAGFCELKKSDGIVFDTYEADTSEDNWVMNHFLSEDKDNWTVVKLPVDIT